MEEDEMFLTLHFQRPEQIPQGVFVYTGPVPAESVPADKQPAVPGYMQDVWRSPHIQKGDLKNV